LINAITVPDIQYKSCDPCVIADLNYVHGKIEVVRKKSAIFLSKLFKGFIKKMLGHPHENPGCFIFPVLWILKRS